MYVFEDGVFKPFEIMFNGDNDTVVPIDKDQMDFHPFVPFENNTLELYHRKRGLPA